MSRRTRTIKAPSTTGSLSLDDARATVVAVGHAGKKKQNAAFEKAVKPTPTLAAVIGSSAMPRTEVTQKIWGYIKRNGLLDKKASGRIIHADKKLRPVFGGRSDVSLFEMTRLVSKHLK